MFRRLKNWLGEKIDGDECMSCGDSFFWKKGPFNAGIIFAEIEPSPTHPFGEQGLGTSIILCRECMEKERITLNPEKTLKLCRNAAERMKNGPQQIKKLEGTMAKYNYCLNDILEGNARWHKTRTEAINKHFYGTAET